MCGQGEIWFGKKISLILDHINGINNDNRLINLRIVCPNCAASLDTHCGKNVKYIKNECAYCKTLTKNKKYCSNKCYSLDKKNTIRNCIPYRKQNRPTFDILKLEIDNLGYSGTGIKYNVSDNTIRKWEKFYIKCDNIKNQK